MRIPLHDLERPKAAAMKLAAMAAGATLASVQGHLAGSLGYEDWHELRSQPRAPATPAVELRHAAQLILDLSTRLDLLPGDVQFALGSARLLAPMTLPSQLDLRTAVWRSLVGPPARNKPGSVVRDRAYGRGEAAYLRRFGQPTYLLFDTGPGMRGDFEIVQPRVALADFVPARLWLPYGYWILADGSEVLFSRDYLPLWRVLSSGTERMEPWLWIKGIRAQHHFGRSVWASGPVRDGAMDARAKRSLHGLPMLVDAMQILIETSAPSVVSALSSEASTDCQKAPSGAAISLTGLMRERGFRCRFRVTAQRLPPLATAPAFQSRRRSAPPELSALLPPEATPNPPNPRKVSSPATAGLEPRPPSAPQDAARPAPKGRSISSKVRNMRAPTGAGAASRRARLRRGRSRPAQPSPDAPRSARWPPRGHRPRPVAGTGRGPRPRGRRRAFPAWARGRRSGRARSSTGPVRRFRHRPGVHQHERAPAPGAHRCGPCPVQA